MAVSETDTSDCNSDSSVDGMKQGERKERPFTKVIIRRLPPTMNQDTFLTQVSPLPDYDYMYFVKADISLGEYAFARAYINFKSTADIFIFKEKFDNYVFLDAKGNEYAAVVEFAPFSRIPKKRNKSRCDPKCGSVDSDPVYLDFLESLKTTDSNENEEKPEYCFQPTSEEEKKIINTPLLEFVKQRRIDRQKIREEKREERKRKELERKRFKEEERRRRTSRPDHVVYNQNLTKSSTPSASSSKNVQILNATKEPVASNAEEKSKEEANSKYKEKKLEANESRYKSNLKDTSDRKSYSSTYQRSNKDPLRKASDEYLKKSPTTKLRPRNQVDRSSDFKKPDNKTRREESYTRNRRSNELAKEVDEDPRVTEKKVKKYSERREERKNEIKKLETFKSENSSIKQDDISKETMDTDEKQETKDVKSVNNSMSEDSNENYEENSRHCKENDPRSQRRIRNKDRPSLAIYQPGMGLRHRKPTEASSETISESMSEQKTDSN